MKGYMAALPLCLLLGAAGAAHATTTTATIDFDTPANTTAGTQLITSSADGKVTMLNIGGHNAVMTNGTSGTNGYLYVALPKGMFANSKAVWVEVEYYDQGTDTFTLEYDSGGTLTNVTEGAVVKHDTKAWLKHTFTLPGFNFTEGLTGGADIQVDDAGDGPEVIDKIIVTDSDPNVFSFPHTDPSHPVKIDGVVSPGEWDNATEVDLNTAAQDALGGVNWTGPTDFSAKYYYQWDEKGLYVLGDVTDATPRLNDTGTYGAPNYWSGDGFEEFVALDWTIPNHTAYVAGTDFHVFVGLGDPKNGSLPPSWADQSASGTVDWGPIPMSATPDPTKDNIAFVSSTSTGYKFEFFLPWAKMLADEMNTTTKVTAGQQIGWFMFANNSKELPSNQDVAMSPIPRTHPSGNPSVWITTVLGPAPTQPVTNPPAGTTAGTTTGTTTGGATTGGTTTGTTTGGTTTGGTTTGTTTGGTTGQ